MTGTVNITTKSLADNYIYVPENCLVFLYFAESAY